ncbi:MULTISPECIES: response regulator [Pseudomonas]|uniref:response regulator n=1 Tax=Pseudomonas TaxID=286 RepID=UPI00071394D7|nr:MULTISPECIES: response regulator [Pseudomonas]KRP84223.1 hypothetical protein TX25_29255 [Pseudomonas lactis]
MSVNWAELLPITGHVIVIEDEPVVRMLLEETLAEIGFSSATFDNASSALTHLINIKGDCTLIIAEQGPSGGIQGAEFIRLAKEQLPSIPSILTSGYLIDEQVIPPSTIYLHKPYTLDQLETTIATVLRQQRPLLQN